MGKLEELEKRVEELEKNSHKPYDFDYLIDSTEEICEMIKTLAFYVYWNTKGVEVRARMRGIQDLAQKIREDIRKAR